MEDEYSRAGTRDAREIFSFHRVIRSWRSRMRGFEVDIYSLLCHSKTPATRFDDFK